MDWQHNAVLKAELWRISDLPFATNQMEPFRCVINFYSGCWRV